MLRRRFSIATFGLGMPAPFWHITDTLRNDRSTPLSLTNVRRVPASGDSCPRLHRGVFVIIINDVATSADERQQFCDWRRAGERIITPITGPRIFLFDQC